ncbi:hypothetical protein [Promicromonospora sp. AC04]|uniref:hypothetical protein n=1 Tax=Promicromonospora sp. AC04 TaxID=2135723 RepID=UPI0011B21D4C|nr:hypothetical protein [Promicromonospora sp. AC04]
MLADGAILASGSSAALELDREGFVELADHYEAGDLQIIDRDATMQEGIHASIRFLVGASREIKFVNAGFPVNFDGRSCSLPAHMVQGTRALLYGAATQVIDEGSVGLNVLDAQVDEWIFKNAVKYFD